MSDNNRIGEACWYRPTDTGMLVWRGGKLRAWSMDHMEYEAGPGLFPVGVIEDDEHGTCHSIHVTWISFGDSPPE